MLAIALIIFRETLEAALIIGIIAAATRDIPKRTRWIVGGIGLGILGSSVIAFVAEYIAQFADGIGQELFNALILGAAVLMLAWHNIWMSQHGRELALQAKRVGLAIQQQTESMAILLSVIGLAVLREGSEVVLFVQGLVTSNHVAANSLWLGGFFGLMAGGAVGWSLYRGLLFIPLKWFFKITSALVLLLAAGMAAQAARYLIQADLLPTLVDPLWDLTGTLPIHSVAGQTLHLLTGYDPQPTGMQMIFYVATLLAIAVGMWFSQSALAKTRRAELTKLNTLNG